MAEKGIVYPIRGDNSKFQEDTKRTEFIAKGAATAIGNLFSQAFIAAAGAVKNFSVDIYKTGSSFESAFAGVQKTVDATEDQLQGLRDGILGMSKEMPTAADEIAGVAEAAGQLGIKVEDILDFTKVMVNLGVATNMSADEAATALAKIANITGMQASDYSKLGSSIVALGNSFAATESEIVEMTTRLASAGTLAGLTETEMLALSTAMTSVGINAEAGGSSMSQTLTDIGNAVSEAGGKLDTLAETAGMTADEFSATWKSSPMEALQAFLGGLKKTQEAGGDMNAILQELGMTGILQSNMLKSLALASDTLSDAVDTANAGWEENNALTHEAAQRYATVESQEQILSNQTDALKISLYEQLRPAIVETLSIFTKSLGEVNRSASKGALKSAIGNLGKALTGVATVLATIVSKVLPPLISVISTVLALLSKVAPFALKVVTAFLAISAAYTVWTKVTGAISKAVTAYKTLKEAVLIYDSAQKLSAMSTAALSSALSVQEILMGVLTGKISVATAAQTLWNAAMAANPVGVVIASIAALVAIVGTLYAKLKSMPDASRDYYESTKDLASSTRDLAKEVKDGQAAFAESYQAMSDNAAEAEVLADRIDSLMAVENKSEGQKQALADAVSRIKELMPGVKIAYDKEKGAVTGATDAIRKYIEKLKEEAKAKAIQERLVELYKQRLEAESKLSEATRKNTELQAKYNMTVGETRSNTEATNAEIEAAADSWYNYDLAQQEAQGAIEEATGIINDCDSEIEYLNGQLGENAEKQQEIKSELEGSEEATATYTEAQKNLAAALEEMNISTDTAKTAIDGYTSSFVNGFEAIQEKSTMSFDELKANMAHNLEVAQNWTTDLGTIAKNGLDAGLVKELENLGPEAAGLVHEMAGKSSTELEALNEIYRNMGEAGINAYLTELGYKTKNNSAGEDAAKDVAEGLGDSTATQEAGKEMIQETKTAMTEEVKNQNFTSVGLSISQGVAQGIRNGTILIEAAASSAGRAANTAFRKSINSHSPSKLFAESGRTIPQGVAKGIEEDADLPQDALESMVYDLQHSFSVAPVELAMANAAQLPAATSQPVFNINLDADMEVDGVNLGRVVLKNLDDAASFTLRGSRS